MFGGATRAGIWSETAASWVDLNPAGSSLSRAIATTGTPQAGHATFASLNRAGIWSGTAGSWEDLSATLTGSWGDTNAVSIWSDEDTPGHRIVDAAGRAARGRAWRRGRGGQSRGRGVLVQVIGQGVAGSWRRSAGDHRGWGPGDRTHAAIGSERWRGCGSAPVAMTVPCQPPIFASSNLHKTPLDSAGERGYTGD